ncbi:MAG: CPBP family intramembrane metalloprotease, partial [Gemmatimonadales bacterium]|nr:CPBP family intramembrane metalloprotease [Gemmatimonadales bacterium]
LGLLYLASGNLLAPIVTHALYDLAALSVLARVNPAAARSVV